METSNPFDDYCKCIESGDFIGEAVATLKLIQKRTWMYVRKDYGYNALAAYVAGYLHSLSYRYDLKFKKLHGQSLLRDSIRYFCEKESLKSSDFNVPLCEIVKIQYAHLDDDGLVDVYLDVLIEFFKSKQSAD